MTDINAQTIQHIQETSTAAKRQALITLDDGSGRRFLYNDRDQKYDPIDPWVKKADTVSNIESFIDLVLAEAARRDNATGERMNVIFSDTGAILIPNTDDRRDLFTYVRKPSIHWKTLTDGLDEAMPHKQFLTWLESLRPIIGIDTGTPDKPQFVSQYAEIAAAFRVLRLSTRAKMLSEPLLNDAGTKGSTIDFKIEVAGVAGGVDVKIPQSFPVLVQFARGDKRKYAFDVMVDINPGPNETPVITPYAAAVDAVSEQAVVDEMEEFEQATGDLPKLLNLVNF